jgi:SAM-dependent methyltransferase
MSDIKELLNDIGKEYIGGSSAKGKIYHDIPFDDFPCHRKNTQMRVDLILKNYNVKGKKGIDLGCNAGGFTFRLQQAGARMLGIDYDTKTYAFAQAIENKYKTGAEFQCQYINMVFANEMKKYDFCIWFDCFMWVIKSEGIFEAKKILNKISEKCDVMFFSTSQDNGLARNEIKTEIDVANLLKINTRYKRIFNFGVVNDGWHKRTIFKCS